MLDRLAVIRWVSGARHLFKSNRFALARAEMDSADSLLLAQHYYKSAEHANKGLDIGYHGDAPVANVLDKAQFEADKQAVYR